MTKKDLEMYRAEEAELRRMRSSLASAQRRARLTELEADRERARVEAAMYEAHMAALEDKLLEVSAAIHALADPRHREVLRLRYIDGKSRVQAAFIMGTSEASVDKWQAAAIREMEKQSE